MSMLLEQRLEADVSASVTLWRDRFVFTSTSLYRSSSERPSIVLLVSPRADLVLINKDVRYEGRAFVVNTNVVRAIEAEAGLYSLHLDLANRTGKYLRHDILAGRDFLKISDIAMAPVLPLIDEIVFSNKNNCLHAYSDSQKVLENTFPGVASLPPIDMRVELAVNWLWSNVPPKIDLSALARMSGLSSSRLAHLFTQEVGISLRQYLLWVKVRKAAELFGSGHSLTTVAHQVGFADSAHLSRTFQRFFSWKPSFLSNRKLLHVHVCEQCTTGRDRRSK